MGIHTDKDFSFYISPKTGGTTIRHWIAYYINKGPVTQEERISIVKKAGYHYGGYRKSMTSLNVCIKRNPLDRFVSCYTDKILFEKMSQFSIEHLLLNWNTCLDKGPVDNFQPGKQLKNHFKTQTNYLGSDKNYFDIVFDTSEINTTVKEFLEDHWKIKLPDVHERKHKLTKPTLTPEQKRQVMKRYEIDYNNGWC